MADQLPLPRGWEIRFTENKKKYFIDHNTRTTTFVGNANNVKHRTSSMCIDPNQLYIARLKVMNTKQKEMLDD